MPNHARGWRNSPSRGLKPTSATDQGGVRYRRPERDTPQRVQEYVDHFSASFIGLSGDESELATVWSDYGIFREVMDSESATGYLVNHTARILLIDRNGNLRLSFPYDAPVEDIIHDLKLVLER
ncbi:MAG: SCO family protein [Anaerolineae bacterium]|nr:SCO family protein [Anaerolineae bacterium]